MIEHEAMIAELDISQLHIVQEAEENGSAGDQFYCIVCKKNFKSEKQWKNHEQSKAHKLKVEQLREELLLDEEKEEEEPEITPEKEKSSEEEQEVQDIIEEENVSDEEEEINPKNLPNPVHQNHHPKKKRNLKK